MGVILIPMLYYPIFAWNQHTKEEMSAIKYFVIQVIYLGIIFICAGYVLFIWGFDIPQERDKYKDKRIKFADIYAPIIGFLVMMHSLFILALIPVMFRSGVQSIKSSKKKNQ